MSQNISRIDQAVFRLAQLTRDGKLKWQINAPPNQGGYPALLYSSRFQKWQLYLGYYPPLGWMVSVGEDPNTSVCIEPVSYSDLTYLVDTVKAQLRIFDVPELLDALLANREKPNA